MYVSGRRTSSWYTDEETPDCPLQVSGVLFSFCVWTKKLQNLYFHYCPICFISWCIYCEIIRAFISRFLHGSFLKLVVLVQLRNKDWRCFNSFSQNRLTSLSGLVVQSMLFHTAKSSNGHVEHSMHLANISISIASWLNSYCFYMFLYPTERWSHSRKKNLPLRILTSYASDALLSTTFVNDEAAFSNVLFLTSR